jgi:hypothetical protein
MTVFQTMASMEADPAPWSCLLLWLLVRDGSGDDKCIGKELENHILNNTADYQAWKHDAAYQHRQASNATAAMSDSHAMMSASNNSSSINCKSFRKHIAGVLVGEYSYADNYLCKALGNYILSNTRNNRVAPLSNTRQRAMVAMRGSHATTSMPDDASSSNAARAPIRFITDMTSSPPRAYRVRRRSPLATPSGTARPPRWLRSCTHEM